MFKKLWNLFRLNDEFDNNEDDENETISSSREAQESNPPSPSLRETLVKRKDGDLFSLINLPKLTYAIRGLDPNTVWVSCGVRRKIEDGNPFLEHYVEIFAEDVLVRNLVVYNLPAKEAKEVSKQHLKTSFELTLRMADFVTNQIGMNFRNAFKVNKVCFKEKYIPKESIPQGFVICDKNVEEEKYRDRGTTEEI